MGTLNLLSNAFYRSPLIVTGVLPGVYRYSVNNKATPTSKDRDFNIEGILNIITHYYDKHLYITTFYISINRSPNN